MSFTLTTLRDAIKSYLQNYETTFTTTYVDTSITQAEDRINKAAILPVNRTYASLTVTPSTATVPTPTGFLAPFYIQAIVSSEYFPVDFVDASFIRTAYPLVSVTGRPRYYTVMDDTSFLVAPTPDNTVTMYCGYFKKPASLTAGAAGGTTWLSTNAPNCLLYGALSEAYSYMKGDPALQQEYEKRFQVALGDLKTLGEGMDLGDAYLMGERRLAR